MRDSSAYTRLLAVQDMRRSVDERREWERLRRMSVAEALERARTRAAQRRGQTGRVAMPMAMSAALDADVLPPGALKRARATKDEYQRRRVRRASLPYKD